jgi:PAS domain S-box-containing protein
MHAEYTHIKKDILYELQAKQLTFEPILTQSLWRMDRSQWKSTIDGMMKSPMLIGVKLLDEHKNMLYAKGTILDHKGSIFLADADANITNYQYSSLFEHHFNLSYANQMIGEISLYSSNVVVFQKVKVGFAFIILNAIIKTFALWILFVWVGWRLLNRPLKILTNSLRQFDIDTRENFKIDIQTKRHNELKLLEEAFNAMIIRLNQAITESQDNEAKFRAIVEHVPVMIFSLDHNNRCHIWNKEAQKQLGYTLEDIQQLSKSPVEFIFSKDERTSNVKNKNIQKDGTFKVYHSQSKDGMIKTQEWAYFSLPDGQTIGIGRDLTEQCKIESELRQAHKMEALGAFSGGIAHDFNNIIAIILGNLEIALDDVSTESSLYASLEEAKTASLRGKELIKQILSFSRKSLPEKEPIAISPLVKESVRLLRSAIPVTVKIIDHIKKIDDAILANSTQINQIVLNLCSNAIQAMNNVGTLEIGLEKIHIHNDIIKPLKAGDYVKFFVSDTGCGIDPKMISRIFEPFFTTKPKGKGTGMGLSVVYGIVKAHEGTITVDSQPDKGTVFNVYLPIIKSEIKTKIDLEAPVIGGSEHILYVDDEEMLVRLGERVLKTLGYKVTCFTQPKDALEAFRVNQKSFDLVITDMTMPDLPGHQLAAEILKIKSDMPIIICSGYSDEMNEKRMQELKIRKWVMKPLTKKDFARTIREVLDS